jgi:putative ferrous iron transport protein C
MLLSDIRSYCAETGHVSLQELSNRFDTDPEAIRGMMDVLARKGMIRCLTDAGSPACGGGCSCCTTGCASLRSMPDAVYEWIGRTRRGDARRN